MSKIDNHVIVSNIKGYSYEFDLTSKYTIVLGDSGTGKSCLIDCIFRAQHKSTKVKQQRTAMVMSDYEFRVLNSEILMNTRYTDWHAYFCENDDPLTVFCCDEDFVDLYTTEFQNAVIKSRSKFLIVSRDPLNSLPYGIDDVYKIVTEGKINRLVSYKFSSKFNTKQDIHGCRQLFVEDAGSGFKFFSSFLKNVKSMKGKSNILDYLKSESRTLFCLDGLGSGSLILKINEIIDRTEDRFNVIWMIDSFEKLVLDSDFITSKVNVPDADEYCANKEQFYYQILRDLLKDINQSYDKAFLPKCLYVPCCENRTPHSGYSKCYLYSVGNKQLLILGEDVYYWLYNQFGGSTDYTDVATNLAW